MKNENVILKNFGLLYIYFSCMFVTQHFEACSYLKFDFCLNVLVSLSFVRNKQIWFPIIGPTGINNDEKNKKQKTIKGKKLHCAHLSLG